MDAAMLKSCSTRQTSWCCAARRCPPATARLPAVVLLAWLALPLRQPACRAPAQVSPSPAVRPPRVVTSAIAALRRPRANRIGQSTSPAIIDRTDGQRGCQRLAAAVKPPSECLWAAPAADAMQPLTAAPTAPAAVLWSPLGRTTHRFAPRFELGPADHTMMTPWPKLHSFTNGLATVLPPSSLTSHPVFAPG